MSKLTTRKTKATFETLDAVFSQGHNRPVCIELHATHMDLRLKGTRKSYSFPYSTAFSQALNAALLAERRAKNKAM